MKVIFQELRNVFRSKKVKKWIGILSVAILIISIAMLIGRFILFPSVKIGVIGEEDSHEWDVLSQAMIDAKQGESVMLDMDFSRVEPTINLFFLAAKEKNVDMFTSVLSPEQLNKDFTSNFDLAERFKKYDEAMNRITRNGKLSKVEIVRGFRMIGVKKSRIVLDLYYEDLSEPIRVSLVLKAVEQSHYETEHDPLSEVELNIEYTSQFITSSVWDLIDAIEESGRE